MPKSFVGSVSDFRVWLRLEYFRKQIEQECLSYGEIAELQSLARYIAPGDTVLEEWAGVPETWEKYSGYETGKVAKDFRV